jgi:hypothetical protein
MANWRPEISRPDIMYVYVACVPAHRPHKDTLYDIPPIRSAFQVTQTNPRSSLMMADHCRNMQEPVY